MNQWLFEEANKNIISKFGDLQLPDIMNFPGGATSIDSFLKAYKASKLKKLFPYERFDQLDKILNTEIPPYDAFYRNLSGFDLLEAEETEYGNLVKSGMTAEQAVAKLKLLKTPPTGVENYQ